MRSYRIYFRGLSGAILGRDDFEADDDRTALAMAALLCDACADICTEFELWQGARRVDAVFGKTPLPKMNAHEIAARTQEALRRREEAIRDSQWAIARSKRLLKKLTV